MAKRSKSESFKIESNVKMPPKRGRSSAVTDAASKMKVGQSFIGGSPATVTVLNKRLRPKRFSSRVVNGKRRIWRTK